MNDYQIITDSSCDFSPEMYKKLNLKVVPLTLQFRGKETEDKSDDSLRTLYKGLREGEAASTSAINIGGWTEAMEAVLKQGRDVLVLAFSSGLPHVCVRYIYIMCYLICICEITTYF